MTITLMQSCGLECMGWCFHSPPPYNVVTWLAIKQAYRTAIKELSVCPHGATPLSMD